VVSLALLTLANGRDGLGGALVGVAIVVKPYALILAPWLVARGRPRAVAGAGAVLAVALTMPVLAWGWDGSAAQYAGWWHTVKQTTAGVLVHSNNISVASLFAKWLGPGAATMTLTAVISVMLLAVAAVVCLRRRDVAAPDGLEAGLLLMLTPLLSPQGWDYVAVVATIAAARLANHEDQLPRPWRVAAAACLLIVGLTLYDLLGRRLVYLVLDHGGVTLAMLGMVAVLTFLRVRRLA
jgi:hypothetical protein